MPTLRHGVGVGSTLEADTGHRRTGKRTLPGTAPLRVSVTPGTGVGALRPPFPLPADGGLWPCPASAWTSLVEPVPRGFCTSD